MILKKISDIKKYLTKYKFNVFNVEKNKNEYFLIYAKNEELVISFQCHYKKNKIYIYSVRIGRVGDDVYFFIDFSIRVDDLFFSDNFDTLLNKIKDVNNIIIKGQCNE